MSIYAEGDINSDAKGSGARANKGKIDLTLVPMLLLGGVTRVFMGGCLKYQDWNWAKGMKWGSAMACTLRHLFKWWYLREDIDPESGEHHLDHVLANVFMLKHYSKAYLEGDNRPPKSAMFDVWLEDFCETFDEDAYFERNPDIKAIIEERKAEALAEEVWDGTEVLQGKELEECLRENGVSE
jgi:hypothetical protein